MKVLSLALATAGLLALGTSARADRIVIGDPGSNPGYPGGGYPGGGNPGYPGGNPGYPGGNPGYPGGGGRNGGGGAYGSLAYQASQVRDDANLLTQILARGAGQNQANQRLVYNSGLLAKNANDLVNLLTGQGEECDSGSVYQVLQSVEDAWKYLSDYYRFSGPHSYYEDNAFQQLSCAVNELEYASGGGGGYPGDGRDDGGYGPGQGDGGYPDQGGGGYPDQGGGSGFPGDDFPGTSGVNGGRG